MIKSNIAIRTLSPAFVDFLYPNYTRSSVFSPFIEGGVIYDGDSKYLQSFRDANIPYIYVKGTPEYDLTIPEVLLNFVFDKWGKKPSNKLVEYFKSFDKVNVELEDICKQIWVTGKYTLDDIDENELFNMYKAFARGATYDLIDKYLKLSESAGKEKIFYKVQKFLLDSTKNEGDVSGNIKYKTNVRDFAEIRGRDNAKSSLMSYLYSPADSVELKMLALFDTITRNHFESY